MANIIINNYCNQTCSYCFAWKNMQDKSLKKEMSITTFLYCLRHLRTVGDNEVRILWWEPLLYKNIKKIIQISVKGGFKMIIFSNLKISLSRWNDILDLWSSYDYSNIMFNLNLNDKDFYKKEELDLIYNSLKFLRQRWCDIIISYNIYEYSNGYDFIFDTAKKFDIKKVLLKVTNAVYGDIEMIDTNSRDYGKYIIKILDEYIEDFHLGFGCGLSKKIFTESELVFLKEKIQMKFGFWCSNARGRYDINTDGSISHCYPLQSLYEWEKEFHIRWTLFQNNSISKIYDLVTSVIPKNQWLILDENCLANQMNKNQI